MRRVDALLKQGYSWVVDADLKSYFDTIPRAETRPDEGSLFAAPAVLKWGTTTTNIHRVTNAK